MGAYKIQSETLTGLCNAVRGKEGTTALIPTSEIASRIRGIKSGGFPNGTEWTQSNVTKTGFQNIHNAASIWVAGGNGLYYSTDGKAWARSNITSDTFRSVYYANGIWVAGGNSSGLYYSTDGQTWTQSNITSGTFQSLHNTNGIWVAGGTGLYYSVTWEVS